MLGDKDRGLLLNLTGDGKGKSTSAFGTAVRALGWGWRVAILQFLKGDRMTGERNFFTTHFPEMIFEDLGLGLSTHPGDHAGAARRGWERAKELLANAEFVLIGGGAGLSAAAGLTYGGKRFRDNFADFIELYNMTDMYSVPSSS